MKVEVIDIDGEARVYDGVGNFVTEGELAIYQVDGKLGAVYPEGAWRRVEVLGWQSESE